MSTTQNIQTAECTKCKKVKVTFFSFKLKIFVTIISTIISTFLCLLIFGLYIIGNAQK